METKIRECASNLNNLFDEVSRLTKTNDGSDANADGQEDASTKDILLLKEVADPSSNLSDCNFPVYGALWSNSTAGRKLSGVRAGFIPPDN